MVNYYHSLVVEGRIVTRLFRGFRLQLSERHNALRVIMNAHVSTTLVDMGLGPSLALVESATSSLQTPYLAAIDVLRMITDVVSPSAKLNVVGMHISSGKKSIGNVSS